MAPVLALLALLFAARVAGQWLVERDAAPWLPPRAEWASGLIPYPALLAAQIAILVTLALVVRDFARGRGFFVHPRRFFAVHVRGFGLLYLASMLIRYGVLMAIRPDLRWHHGSLPIVFHLVLATFLLVFSHYHRTSLDVAPRVPRPAVGTRGSSSSPDLRKGSAP